MGDRLTGRRALVTGGGQGVGRGIALALADEGARVALVGRTASKLKAVAKEIEARGGEAATVVADLCDPAQIDRAVRETKQALGGVDILVNNAVVYSYGRLLDVKPDVIEAAWQSGPRATLLLMRACHTALADGGGVIINLGSGASHLWDPSGLGVYAATKAAIVSLTRTAAVEWASDGIRAYCVMPAAEGPAHEAWKKVDPAGYEATLAKVPQRRFGDPERDIGRVVAFLCSDDASYTTGMIVPVDGGSTWIG